MIISLHLPKTAGNSFLASLSKHYGTKLLRDYTSPPIRTPVYERNKAALQESIYNAEKDFGNIECIHGHFLPIKYLLLSDQQKVSFVTWMRHPVERVTSHYYFWKRNFKPQKASSLQRKVIEENWSLEKFCLAQELKDLYSQFLYGFPLEYFSFIGITEFYEDDLYFFSTHYLKSCLEPKKLNVGKEGGNYSIEKSLRNDIEQFHHKDMILYNRALENRLARLSM